MTTVAASIKDTMADLAPATLAISEKPRNLYQRKLEMTADLMSEKPDKKHGQGYMYFSVHHVEAVVARAGITHGVDVSPEVISTPDGLACIVTLTNVDDPEDKLVKQFTNQGLPKDPANSYIIKYSYVRLFHLADEEDADATMNTRPAPRAAVIPPVPQPSQAIPQVAAGAATSTPPQLLLRDLKAKFGQDHEAAKAWCAMHDTEFRTSVLMDLPAVRATELINDLANGR